MSHVFRKVKNAVLGLGKKVQLMVTQFGVKAKMSQENVHAACKKASDHLSAHELLAGTAGGSFLEDAGGWLIAVVIGFFILVAIYALFKTGVIPNVTNKTSSMFTYSS